MARAAIVALIISSRYVRRCRKEGKGMETAMAGDGAREVAPGYPTSFVTLPTLQFIWRPFALIVLDNQHSGEL